MGLAVDSIKNTLTFLKNFPKSFVYSLLCYLLISIGNFLLPTAGLLIFSLGIPGTIIILAIAIIISVTGSALISGGFPILVKQAINKKRISLSLAFRKSLARILKVILTEIIVGVIVALPILIFSIFWIGTLFAAGFFSLFSPVTFLQIGASVLLIAIGIIISVYLFARLWLALPVVMIEKKGVIDSIKTSWKITKGKVISILVTICLGILILLPLIIISVVLDLLFPLASSAWNFIQGVISSTFFGALIPIYYFSLKHRKIIPK
jgi:glycerophosphoryl diester phosphodiesterase